MEVFLAFVAMLGALLVAVIGAIIDRRFVRRTEIRELRKSRLDLVDAGIGELELLRSSLNLMNTPGTARIALDLVKPLAGQTVAAAAVAAVRAMGGSGPLEATFANCVDAGARCLRSLRQNGSLDDTAIQDLGDAIVQARTEYEALRSALL